MAKAVVRPKQNYSELPQKPITLKEGIGGLAATAKMHVESVQEPVVASTTKPKKKIPTKRKRVAGDLWMLRGVSKSARDAAVKAAKAEGVKLGEWLNRTILQATEGGVSQQQLLELLQDMQNRLERIEFQRGFFSRLWEKLKSRTGW